MLENPVSARDFLSYTPLQTVPGIHSAPCTMGAGALSSGYSGRGMAMITHFNPTQRNRTGTAKYMYPLSLTSRQVIKGISHFDIR